MSYRASTPDEEAEATQFAMELLMPAEWVVEEYRKMGSFDIQDTVKMKKLSQKFGVEPVVLAIRMGQITIK